MTNVLPLPIAARATRRVIYSRSGAARTVEVIEERLHGQALYEVHVKNKWTDALTIIGPLSSQGVALQQARWEVR